MNYANLPSPPAQVTSPNFIAPVQSQFKDPFEDLANISPFTLSGPPNSSSSHNQSQFFNPFEDSSSLSEPPSLVSSTAKGQYATEFIPVPLLPGQAPINHISVEGGSNVGAKPVQPVNLTPHFSAPTSTKQYETMGPTGPVYHSSS